MNTDERELTVTTGGESLSIFEIMQRYRNDGSCEHVIQDALQRLFLLDNQAAGGDAQVLNDIRQRVADGYESASSRNVITVAALTLKDLHYVLSSHDGQFIRGATQMRDKCVAKVREYLTDCRDEETGIIEAIASALRSLTTEQREKKDGPN